jgi:Asp-tRNA(Asn)/Glu-tRNA(Gln) amidotransferase A subunit family amidase
MMDDYTFTTRDQGARVGVQFAAALRREDLLLAFAGQIERTRSWSDGGPPA